MTREQIIENARRLFRKEQIDLAMEFWGLVKPGEADLPLTHVQKAELDRRIAEHERNPNDARPWSEVRREILQELEGKE